MNKQELIEKVSKSAGMSKLDAEKAIKSFTDVVTDALVNGDKVQVVGFGTFDIIDRAAREGHNPITGESMHIPSSKSPKFKAGKLLKDAVNGK